MAINGRHPVAPARKVFAAVLGAIAVFVMVFGAGFTSWAIVALGVALLVLAVSLALVTVVRRGGRAWVAGTAHVVSASEPPAASVYGRCELQLIVDAPGMPAAAVKVRDPRVPVAKWPDAGTTLPVQVAVDDMRHVRIQWDEVMTHTQTATMTGAVPPEYGDGAPKMVAEDVPVQDTSAPWAPFDDPAPASWETVDDRSWAARRSGPDPRAADLSDQLGGVRTEPVRVRETPGGPIVLEGTLVEPGGEPAAMPLPRRGARPRPRPYPRRTADATPPAHPDPPPPDHADPPPPDHADPPPPDHTDQTPPDRAEPAGTTPAGTTPAGQAVPGQREAPTAGSGPHSTPRPRSAPDAAATTTTTTATGGGPDSAEAAADPGPAYPDERIDDIITAYPGARSGAVGPIHGVGLTVLVTDLVRSVHFYRDMLGFQQIDGGPDSAVLASGDTRLVIRAVTGEAPLHQRPVHLNLEVGDLDAAFRDLTAKGVNFAAKPRPVNRGDRLELWEATFSDPDGHDIALTQWRAVD